MLATLALAALVVPQAPAGAAKAVPMAVEVRTAAKRRTPVQAWAKELRAALDQRKDEFRRAKPGETRGARGADRLRGPGTGWRAGR